MAILTKADYSKLDAMNLEYKEDEQHRFLVFKKFALIEGLYQVNTCEILVVIPETYPTAGNDMLWTYPRLLRTDNLVIPGTIPETEANRYVQVFEDKIYERWSRHWNSGNQLWRPGRDEIGTIVNRLTYVLANSHEA